jgi:hypothetical protein
MNRNIIKGAVVLVLVFFFSFILNFVWESLHAVFLYEGHDFNAKKYVLMVCYVSAIDGILILGIYLFIAVLWRNILWLQKMSAKHICVVLITGLLLAAVIEYRKVFITKTWSYNQLMPTVLGLGVSPLIQLGITGLLAVWLSKRVSFSS